MVHVLPPRTHRPRQPVQLREAVPDACHERRRVGQGVAAAVRKEGVEVGPVVGEEAVQVFHLLQKLRDAGWKGGVVVAVAQGRCHRDVLVRMDVLLQTPAGGLTDKGGMRRKQGSRRHQKGGGGGQQRQNQGERERFY